MMSIRTGLLVVSRRLTLGGRRTSCFAWRERCTRSIAPDRAVALRLSRQATVTSGEFAIDPRAITRSCSGNRGQWVRLQVEHVDGAVSREVPGVARSAFGLDRVLGRQERGFGDGAAGMRVDGVIRR